MKYEFTSDVKTFDYWLLSMYNTYHSLVGVVNVVFFLSMIGLCFRFWNVVGDVSQTMLFVGLLLIPVIHPFGVYLKAKTQAMVSPKGTKLSFSEKGILVTLGDKRETIYWNKIVTAVKRCGMIIIYSDMKHGYILTGRVLKKERKEVFEYIKAHLKKR